MFSFLYNEGKIFYLRQFLHVMDDRSQYIGSLRVWYVFGLRHVLDHNLYSAYDVSCIDCVDILQDCCSLRTGLCLYATVCISYSP